jgi:thiopurine S-methyltransferase
MDHDFWHERWQQNQIGFHQDEVHPLLSKFWPEMSVTAGARVFVPLCGKSLDLWWLRQQGHQVVGVELSKLAVEAFFEEAGVTPARTSNDLLECWQASDITLYCGDFFALRPQDVAGCGLIYDRASLIALPPAMRRDYVKHLHRLFPQGARMLLVTLDYPQAEMDGPPFSVSDAEVRELYGSVQLLESRDVLPENDRFRQRGVSKMTENAYLIELKPCNS